TATEWTPSAGWVDWRVANGPSPAQCTAEGWRAFRLKMETSPVLGSAEVEVNSSPCFGPAWNGGPPAWAGTAITIMAPSAASAVRTLLMEFDPPPTTGSRS